MGPGHRLGSEASDFDRQVPRQRQWNSATQTKGELTTVADRPTRDTRQVMRKDLESSHTPVGVKSSAGRVVRLDFRRRFGGSRPFSVMGKTASLHRCADWS